jgi:hypothetical protein
MQPIRLRIERGAAGAGVPLSAFRSQKTSFPEVVYYNSYNCIGVAFSYQTKGKHLYIAIAFLSTTRRDDFDCHRGAQAT